MKVLQICPLWYPISLHSPGGIESLLAQLCPGLKKAGCELTFLATADSTLTGELVPVVERGVCALMEEEKAKSYEPYEQQALRLAVDRLDRHDILHSHLGPNGLLLSRLAPERLHVLHTLHCQVLDDLTWYLRQNPNVLLTTVSAFQREKLTKAGVTNECHVIHNGVDTSVFPFWEAPDDRLLFIGRMEFRKGPDLAIGAAVAAGLPIDLVGPITEGEFFHKNIHPMLTEANRYMGVVRGARKLELLGSACCVLMPSRWEEPFGMTAVEAMACGTPVVALRSGALSEIVENGLNGFVVDSPEQLPDAIRRARLLDRRIVRDQAVQRFDISITTSRYLSLYESLTAREL
jgi:glycosyltransferase involved in cell wall biosynthesis